VRYFNGILFVFTLVFLKCAHYSADFGTLMCSGLKANCWAGLLQVPGGPSAQGQREGEIPRQTRNCSCGGKRGDRNSRAALSEGG